MTIVCLRNDIGMPSEFVGPIFIQISFKYSKTIQTHSNIYSLDKMSKIRFNERVLRYKQKNRYFCTIVKHCSHKTSIYHEHS